MGLSAALDPARWAGRRVLVTGHTGFKGAWLSLMLVRLGAEVHGVALRADRPSLFELAAIGDAVTSRIGDLTDPQEALGAVLSSRPEIVFHLAAEALVRGAHARPARTFAANVMGTVNLLEAVRSAGTARAVLIVTSDKVYRNDGSGTAFSEADALGGHEPYGASKAAQEMVAAAWGTSYLEPAGIALATARAGNVIGGGDFAADRLVPDLVRAAQHGGQAALRHPGATRPWQHVLDCLTGYIAHAEALLDRPDTPRALNFGPERQGITVAELADAFAAGLGNNALWRAEPSAGPAEAKTLSVDSTLARKALGWREAHVGDGAIRETVAWYRAWLDGADMAAFSRAAVDRHLQQLQVAE